MGSSRKTLHLVSLGCVKNRVDAEVMLGVAERAGMRLVPDAAAAEVIVVNTCGFIEDAKKESIDVILEMAAHKETGACEMLVVAGCLPQRYPAELAADLPEVDYFLGSSDALALERLLAADPGGEARRVLVGNPDAWLVRASDPRIITTGRASAYVKIAEGCSRQCAFCVIPSIRGKQRSRPVDDVVREVEGLVSGGVREVNLVSQDTIAYGRDQSGPQRAELADLLERVADVPNVHWVRLLYLYPEALPDRLVELLAHHPRVLPYVDMPLQHVTDGMLRRMRRGHGGQRLREVVEKLRRDIDRLVLRTAFIVGHPGESEQDFEQLCEFVRWARFDRVAAFCYSDEEQTASHALPNKVESKVARARYRKLMTLQKKISLEINRTLIGKQLEVLVEGPSEDHPYVLAARYAGQAPEIDGQVFLSDGEATAGTFRQVRIAQASHYDLVGELIDEPVVVEAPPYERRSDGSPHAEGPDKRRVALPLVRQSYR